MTALAPPCVVDVASSADGTRVTVEGEIDMFNADVLEDALRGLPATAPAVLDLRACLFMDASGAHAIGRARRRLGDHLRVRTEPGSIPERVLGLLAAPRG